MDHEQEQQDQRTFLAETYGDTPMELELAALDEAREHLANASPAEYEAANTAVIEAENTVRFGRVRGWNYTDPEGA